MLRALGLTFAVILISACGPTFEAEYHAAQQELSQVKLLLAEAQKKLSAADHETRSKIFSLARRANTHLLATPLDNTLLSSVQQEMALLADSYAQLNDSQDITALTALFYTEKLTLVLDLNRSRIHSYDSQYIACLSDLDSQVKKNDIGTMLCEVQADAAARKPRQQYLATLAATLQVGKLLLDERRSDSQLNLQQLEKLFDTEISKPQA